MSAREEPRAAAEAGKDTRDGSQSPAGASTHAEATEATPAVMPLTDDFLDHLRVSGLRLPRRPLAGRPWAPATEPERQLLSEARRLDRAMRLLLEHIGWLYETYAQQAVRRASGPRVSTTCPLSRSEFRVLVAAAAGESPRETARRVLIAESTIRQQRTAARRRLGAKSIPHAVAIAVAAGWITAENIIEGTTP